mmetsp:Transcript_1721/g.3795  ORF Transcript_1721/g.3795 Transcript_1721/m.3795 type:complete len:403 (+) Transcript_1721:197-1405(+)
MCDERRILYQLKLERLPTRRLAHAAVFVALLIFGAFRRHLLLRDISGGSKWQTTAKSRIDSTHRNEESNNQYSQPISEDKSSAPLVYHVSPGSTGSRTLYHASCAAGLPSVHHKSFCLSWNRGVGDASDGVADGARAHFEVLRLYQLAYGCCSLRAKGKLERGGNSTTESLCNMQVDQWSKSILDHLDNVISSGLVGLYDTPYPNLAEQVIDRSRYLRMSPPLIAFTRRDPDEWARSRIKHSLLLCRQEHSLHELGASEFDIIGCVNRALSSEKTGNALRFWDVFEYRSHTAGSNKTFEKGMAVHMKRHQESFGPISLYKPDFFVSPNGARGSPIKESQVTKDLKRLVLADEKIDSEHKVSFEPLTCRGRVNWEMRNDTMVEFYHLPKTCGDSNASVAPLIT